MCKHVYMSVSVCTCMCEHEYMTVCMCVCVRGFVLGIELRSSAPHPMFHWNMERQAFCFVTRISACHLVSNKLHFRKACLSDCGSVSL